MRTLAALLLLALAVVPAAADTVTEPRNETEFPARVPAAADGDTIALEALGTGLRTKWGIKVYAAGLYVAEGADLGGSRHAALIRGAVPRRIVMHFLRDVEAGEVAGTLREGIRKTLPAGHDEVAAAVWATWFGDDPISGDMKRRLAGL
jgi:hypothetical protein